jgi:hypothetical protein
MEAVWPETAVEDANLTVHISTLRRILDAGRLDGSCIQTISGRGYRFIGGVIQKDTNGRSGVETLRQRSARTAPRLSMVVLPIKNLSNDPTQEYFADAMTEDLTTDLSRIAGSFVISCNTAFTYKSRRVSAKQIGTELAHLIHGMAGIRWRVSPKELILFTDWVSRPSCSPDHSEPHPPCPTIQSTRSAFQP